MKKLIVNNHKKIENPSLLDIRTQLGLLLSPGNQEIVLVDTKQGKLKATWKSSVGIIVKFENARSKETLEETKPFMSLRKTISLFSSFAKGEDSWRNYVDWTSQNENKSLKKFIEKLSWPIRGLGIFLNFSLLIFLLIVINDPAANATVDNYFANEPVITGLLVATIGLTWCSFTYTDFFYRYELENEYRQGNQTFIQGFFATIIGIIIMATGFIIQ